MKRIDAIKYFVSVNSRFSDYWSMQEAWSDFVDAMASNGDITERQRMIWGNPCTPETFKRWNNRNFGV